LINSTATPEVSAAQPPLPAVDVKANADEDNDDDDSGEDIDQLTGEKKRFKWRVVNKKMSKVYEQVTDKIREFKEKTKKELKEDEIKEGNNDNFKDRKGDKGDKGDIHI
jgi:hypothetical protein